MSFIPSHKIYASDGVTLIYTIENVLYRNPILETIVPSYVEHTSLRSSGSLIIPGGNKPYDLSLYAVLRADNYTDLISSFENLKSLIALKTRYILKIDKSLTTQDSINVMRLQPIIVDVEKGHCTRFLYYTITFRCNVWS